LAARQFHRSARIRQVGGWGAFFADEHRQASDAATKTGFRSVWCGANGVHGDRCRANFLCWV
jgi:hypothetical protein